MASAQSRADLFFRMKLEIDALLFRFMCFWKRYLIAIQCLLQDPGSGKCTLFSPGLGFSMLSCAHRWVFAIGLVTVLVVFIAPSVDLPATMLSAQQNAQCIMLGITLLRAVILFAVVLFFHERDNCGTSTRFVLRLHPLLCTFLC
jgi:hypothetical protein